MISNKNVYGYGTSTPKYIFQIVKADNRSDLCVQQMKAFLLDFV